MCSSQKCRGPPPRSEETMWKMRPNEWCETESVSSSSTFSGDLQIARQERKTETIPAARIAATRSARPARSLRAPRGRPETLS
jgi:hypothetical protein